MDIYLIFLGDAFTQLNGDSFKLLYYLTMTSASEEADAVEISIGLLMDVLGKSERSVKRLIVDLANKGFITVDDWCLFRLNLNIAEEIIAEDAPEDEKPKRVGFV